MRLFVFHLDILGNDINDIQFESIKLILEILFVFHFDISGKENNDEQL